MIEPALVIEPVEIERVDWFDPRAVALRASMGAETGPLYAPLVAPLSAEVQERIGVSLAVDPAEIVTTILAVDAAQPVGHAALRQYASSTSGVLEVKKVFVPVPQRGRGFSKTLMLALEDIARERGVGELILQTGTLQVEAIALYERLGYVPIPTYGAYTAMPFAVCFSKAL